MDMEESISAVVSIDIMSSSIIERDEEEGDNDG
jgi:hypothetical protein